MIIKTDLIRNYLLITPARRTMRFYFFGRLKRRFNDMFSWGFYCLAILQKNGKHGNLFQSIYEVTNCLK